MVHRNAHPSRHLLSTLMTEPGGMTDPADLIKKLKTKPGDPDLLRRLDQAAWECFHDPWEEPPVNASEPQPGPGRTSRPKATSPLARLSASRLQSALEQLGQHPCSLGSGSFIMKVGLEHDPACDSLAQVAIRREAKDLLSWQMSVDRELEASQFDLALRFCNEWTCKHRWPRAYLAIRESPQVEGGLEPVKSSSIELEYHFPIPDGISQEGLLWLLASLFAAASLFYSQAREKYGL